jgi:iron complex outermembrane receptor protein
MKTRLIILTSFLCFGFLAFCQNPVIGKVYDVNHIGIPSVKVSILSTNAVTFTNNTGSFILKDIPKEPFTVQFFKEGMYPSYFYFQPNEDNTLFEMVLYDNIRNLDEVPIVSAKSPLEKQSELGIKMDKLTLEKKNFGQDVPFLLDAMPSVVTTSDAGAGLGYSGIRVRGMDASRINVTINGIPVNDPESHEVYWVNMPDLVSSAESISLQRGVSSSSNGAAAFGASLNLKTNDISKNAFGVLDNSFGSFNTFKNSIKAGTGLIKDKFFLETRLSRISSDGYIDRASSNLRSWYLSGGYVGKKSVIKAIAFSGKEITYQSWYGTPESRVNGDVNEMNAYADRNYLSDEERQNLLNSGRTYNYYTYDNQVDNYQQDNYQLHFNHSFNYNWKLNIAAHYTHGFGYYEEFKVGQDFTDYGLNNVFIGNDTITSTDLIRRRWLDNHFVGTVYSLNYSKPKYNIVFGGSANTYLGKHFGEIIWAQMASNSNIYDRYYDEDGRKNEWNNYLKGEYFIGNWSLYGDLQLRQIQYSFIGKDDVSGEIKDITQNVDYLFFNPKGAIHYKLNNNHSLIASFGVSNREPVRRDFRESTPDSRPKHETLHDFEFGYLLKHKKIEATVNLYRMDYINQLVLTGMINDVGGYTRTNVDKSYRQGVEFVVKAQPLDYLTLNGNLTLSQNKIEVFENYVDEYFDLEPYYAQKREVFENTTMALSPQIIASGGISVRPLTNLNIDWTSKYVGAQYLDNTENENRKISPFSYSNVAINYAMKNVLFEEINFGLQVNNLFNTMFSSNGYTFSYNYNNTSITENFMYPQAGRNFMARIQIKL